MKYVALFFCALGFLVSGQNSDPPSGDQARDLWMKMLVAKGVVISSAAISGSASFNTDAGTQRSTIVTSIPGGWWSFDDHRPGKLGYSVTAYDFESH